jgi:hypothetical protein
VNGKWQFLPVARDAKQSQVRGNGAQKPLGRAPIARGKDPEEDFVKNDGLHGSSDNAIMPATFLAVA